MSGLKASEGRALWESLGHQEQGFNLWEAGGYSPPSSDALLSNSLKQNIHTDTASWKRKKIQDAHVTHTHHTHPCPLQAHTPPRACREAGC